MIRPCPGTTSKFKMYYGAYDTHSSTNPLNIPMSAIAANRWGSYSNTTNQCIGDDNDSNNNTNIWNSWYQKSDNLINLGLNAVKLNHPNAQFLDVNYVSVTVSSFTPTRLYHHGLFWYGRITCI